MTEWKFKNGIEITLPKGTTFAQWSSAKMMIDILIGTPSRGEPVQFFPDRRKGRKVKWRTPKTLKT